MKLFNYIILLLSVVIQFIDKKTVYLERFILWITVIAVLPALLAGLYYSLIYNVPKAIFYIGVSFVLMLMNIKARGGTLL